MGRVVEVSAKSDIYGVDILILICVGASEYRFDRLLKIIDHLCESKIINGKDIIAQIGFTTYKPKYYHGFDLISREDFQKYVDQADLIIAHAGTGCVLPPLKLGKKVIVFPRREKYNEHLDDHQLELCEVLASAGYVMKAETEEELKKCIRCIDEFKPKKVISNTKRISDYLINYIEDM